MKYIVTLVAGAIIGAIVGALWIGPERIGEPPAQAAAGLSEEDVAAIRSLNEAHVQDLLAGDWAADAAHYAEDAVRLPPSGTVIRGRAAIEASLAQLDTVLDMTVSAVEIDGRGDLAYAWNTYSITYMPRGSTNPIADTGQALLVSCRQPDGSWSRFRVIRNSDCRFPRWGRRIERDSWAAGSATL